MALLNESVPKRGKKSFVNIPLNVGENLVRCEHLSVSLCWATEMGPPRWDFYAILMYARIPNWILPWGTTRSGSIKRGLAGSRFVGVQTWHFITHKNNKSGTDSVGGEQTRCSRPRLGVGGCIKISRKHEFFSPSLFAGSSKPENKHKTFQTDE